MTIRELVDTFAENVAAQTEAIWNGNSKTGNKHAKRMNEALKALRSHGPRGLDALAELLSHERMDVRVSAAAELLEHIPAKAEAVLHEAATGKGLIPFIAQQVLKQHKKPRKE